MTPIKFQSETDVLILNSVDSTNDEARRRLAAGLVDPFVIAAREQTKGRGRSGRSWQSGAGNLAATFFLPFAGSWQEAARLGFAVSLGVRDTIQDFASGAQLTLKWPNDVLLNGRKVCGILLENIGKGPGDSLQILIGIGINLRTHPDPDSANWPPTSILAETGSEPQFGEVLDRLAIAVPARIMTEQQHGFAETRRNWMSLAARRGAEIRVRLPNETFSGIFNEIDESGALVLSTPSGIRKVSAGDVFFPETARCS